MRQLAPDQETRRGKGRRKSSVASRSVLTRRDSKPVQPTWTALELTTLETHNMCRAFHGVPPLMLSMELSVMAQGWADHLKNTGKFEHCTLTKRELKNQYVGENIAYSMGRTDFTGTDATDLWYKEIEDYSYRQAAFNSGTGHFTQVVWKGTKQLGVGRAVNTTGDEVFIVCRYLPGGNIMGLYQDNVLRSKSID